MSLLPLKTFVNLSTPLFGAGSGSGGVVSSFGDITVSTIVVNDGFIGLGGGEYLSTSGGQLYFNNELVASQSSISSIGDWSLLPAISTVDMAGNSVSSIGVAETSSLLVHGPDLASFISGTAQGAQAELSLGVLSAGQSARLSAGPAETSLQYASATSTFAKIGLSSTLQGAYILDQGNNAYTFTGGLLSAPGGSFSTLYANNISTQTFTAVSTTVVQETISSLNIEADTANFSTLWGQPSSFYLDTISSLNTDAIVCSTLVARDFVSTLDVECSSINGASFGSTSITVEVVGVSSLVANSISSIGAELRTALVSTLQFNPSFSPSLDVNLGLGSLFGNLAGAATGALGVLVGGAALGTGIAALTQSRQTNNLGSPSSFELVNGTTQLQVSTLGSQVSSIFRFVSSLNDETPGQEFFASTIIPAGTVCLRSVSDPLNTVSSPTSTIQYFGQWVSLDEVVPPASTISTFNQLFTSSVGVSTVAFPNGTSLRAGVPWANAGGVSTTELFWNDASPPLDADFRVGALVITGSDVGGINYTKDVLIQNANNGNRLTVFPNASTIAFLSDIPAPQPLVSSFSTIYMGVNGDINILETGSIQLGTGGNPQGSLSAGTNPSLILDGPTSEVAVPAVFTDRLGGKNVTQINVDTGTVLSASTSVLYISTINDGIPYTTANPPPTGSLAANISSLRVSSIGDIGTSSISFTNADLAYLDLNTAGDITGIATNYVNFQAQGTGGQLAGFIANAGGLGSWSNYATGPMFLNASTIRMSTNQVQMNNLSTNFVTLVEADFLGLSTITFSTSTAAGGQSQPAGRLVMSGNDLDLGQQDIWCQQIRLGAGNATNSQSEIVFYDANANIRALNTGLQDRTVRVISTLNGTTGGYLLDTNINPPFFSTINAGTSTALFAFFPSTTNSTIGASTLSVIPNPIFVSQAFSLSSQQVLAANTPLALNLGSFDVNVGGYTVQNSTLTVPVAGTYTFAPSIQFNTTTGGAQVVDFWFTKNGADVPNSASKLSVANNAQTVGTVVFQNTAAAGDQFGIKIASSDANMEAGFFQSTIAPYARPAVPSIIFNTQRVA